jgi:predicted glycoside hydrolase/deacetylase ChbG (UPF0249 family)
MPTRIFILLSLFIFIACTSTRKTALTKLPYLSERYLIITADDFGASKNINEGIKFAAENKAITSISVLSNFTEFLPDLKKISENHPDIGIGVHLNIITGKPLLGVEQVPSLVSPNGSFFTIEEILPKINSISVDDLRKELRAQILILEKYDIRIDNLSDQYGILSIYSPFFDIITELAEEFNIPVRSPVMASVKYPGVLSNSNMVKRGHQMVFRMAFTNPFKAIRLKKYFRIHEMMRKTQKLTELGILHPDLFIECFWGEPTASNLVHILEHLPSGTSELVLHFGSYTRQENYPSGLDLDYFKNREYELLTCTSDYLKEYINYLNISTINYSQLSTDRNK